MCIFSGSSRQGAGREAETVRTREGSVAAAMVGEMCTLPLPLWASVLDPPVERGDHRLPPTRMQGAFSMWPFRKSEVPWVSLTENVLLQLIVHYLLVWL